MEQQAQTPNAPAPIAGTDTAWLLDIRDAGEFLGLSAWQVRGLVSAGELRVVRVGRKFYFRKQALVRWAERAEK